MMAVPIPVTQIPYIFYQSTCNFKVGICVFNSKYPNCTNIETIFLVYQLPCTSDSGIFTTSKSSTIQISIVTVATKKYIVVGSIG